MTQIDRDPRTYALIGAAMEVHRELGPGFHEPVYQEAFEIELLARKIPAEREKELRILYKDRPLSKTYFADFVAYGEVVVEMKVLPALTGRERSQVINYLKASKLHVGLLMNFGTPQLEYERIVV